MNNERLVMKNTKIRIMRHKVKGFSKVFEKYFPLWRGIKGEGKSSMNNE
jgi:hypothetical protein